MPDNYRALKAGEGEHHVYKVPAAAEGQAFKLTTGKHYIAVSAVCWFINREDTWFTKRMASGILDINIGDEEYHVALGKYALSGGVKVAPVFNKPVLEDRNYRGGNLTFSAYLSSIASNTVAGKMLKSAASSSLKIVSGMLETAALSGPANILGAASKDLVSSVREVLDDKELKSEQIFDPSGLSSSYRAEEITGPDTYLLFYRGDDLSQDKISIKENGGQLMPFYKDAILRNGAWLLLRISIRNEYSGKPRPWSQAVEKWKNDLLKLVQTACENEDSKPGAMEQLEPGKQGNRTLYDEMNDLYTLILNDGVLCNTEALIIASLLRTMCRKALKAIEAGDPSILIDGMYRTSEKLAQGKRIDRETDKIIQETAVHTKSLRLGFVDKDTSPKRIQKFTKKEIFENAQYLTKAKSRFSLAEYVK